MPDVLEPYQRTVTVRADDDVAELLRGHQPSLRSDGVGGLLSGGCGRAANLPGRVYRRFAPDRILEVGDGQLQFGKNVGSDPDPHRIVGGTEDLHLADAGNARELVREVDRDVVRKKGLIPGPIGRADGENQQRDADGLLGG